MTRPVSVLAPLVFVVALAGAPAWGGGPTPSSSASDVWSSYLDYAYVYSSSDAAPLRARLDGYGKEAGIPLDRYLREYFETLAPLEADEAESASRREAIAYLLDYLARGDPEALERSLAAIHRLEGRFERHENRYWRHYILAHRALEKGDSRKFVEQVLALWVGVVVPLEGTYDTLDTLALREAPNSGFVAALPYVYENLTRLILLKSQQLGMDRDLDPLGAIVRMLHDGRVGAHADVVPLEASSHAYLDRVVERLNGPESDAGSLTFTLALLEATKAHEQARGMLAQKGLDDETLRAVRRTGAAYETALDRSKTLQGECAVYTRVLRQLGELWAARRRLGVDPELELPFSIEGAVEVYARLHAGMNGGWTRFGYGDDRAAYVDAQVRLWAEIQEASLNAADFYLTRAVEEPHRADAHSRSAARVADRYLAFFHRFARDSGKPAIPESAYFAAYEAARTVGDAYLAYATAPSRSEIGLGTQRYRSALALFPFDRPLWSRIAAALGRHGRESDYAELVRPVAERLVRLRAVSRWIEAEEPHADAIAAVRGALADDLVVVYLGFAEGKSLAELDREVAALGTRRDELESEVSKLAQARDRLRTGSKDGPPAAPDPTAGDESTSRLAAVAGELAQRGAELERVKDQLSARTRALPRYRDTFATDGLADELRSRRDHPLHSLLRRMYHEGRERPEADGDA